MSESFGARSLKRKNVKGLALAAAPPRAATTPSETEKMAPDGPEGVDGPYGRTAQLEIGIEYKLDLKREDLEILKELGSGNGGTVSKVRHLATGTIMARKIIHVEAKKEIRRRIVRELHIMHECNSDYIVNFYGAFLSETNDVIMCMEYMDVGSLDKISRDFGPIRVDVLGKIAEATTGGLSYLYEKHHIMHRDIKPSNILVNSKGFIKLCDFGVSGELVNSIADTFVGTSTYMAPERIQGEKYTVKSDVWSFGLSIMELAIGKFPFDASEHMSEDDGAPAGILDLLQQIVHEPAPKLPKSDAFPSILEDMIQKCMAKDPGDRPTPQELYDREPFVLAAKRTPVDLQEWAFGMMEKHNRKSHLAPQLSPGTQELLRGSDSPIGTGTSPDVGDIPIGGADMTSPREQVINTINSARSINGNGSIGRAGGSSVHPGLGGRVATTNSIPKVTTINAPDLSTNGSSSANAATFSHNLPIRSGGPSGPLPIPPPVPKKEGVDRRMNSYNSAGYN